MAQTQNLGIYQLPNGNWGYRFTRTVDGKRVNRKGSKDENGKPFTTQRAALQAKAIAELRFDAEQKQKPKRRMTFGEHGSRRQTHRHIFSAIKWDTRAARSQSVIISPFHKQELIFLCGI